MLIKVMIQIKMKQTNNVKFNLVIYFFKIKLF